MLINTFHASTRHFDQPAQHVGENIQSLQLNGHVVLHSQCSNQLGRDLPTDVDCEAQTLNTIQQLLPKRSWKVRNLYYIAMIPADEGGSSAMTVFRPMLEMSLSCSLLDTMLEQRVSTIVSTWHSFTFPTRGPRLHKAEIVIITNHILFMFGRKSEWENTIWRPDSALLRFCPPEVWAAWSRLSSRSPRPVWSSPSGAPSSGHWPP